MASKAENWIFDNKGIISLFATESEFYLLFHFQLLKFVYQLVLLNSAEADD